MFPHLARSLAAFSKNTCSGHCTYTNHKVCIMLKQ